MAFSSLRPSRRFHNSLLLSPLLPPPKKNPSPGSTTLQSPLVKMVGTFEHFAFSTVGQDSLWGTPSPKLTHILPHRTPNPPPCKPSPPSLPTLPYPCPMGPASSRQPPNNNLHPPPFAVRVPRGSTPFLLPSEQCRIGAHFPVHLPVQRRGYIRGRQETSGSWENLSLKKKKKKIQPGEGERKGRIRVNSPGLPPIAGSGRLARGGIRGLGLSPSPNRAPALIWGSGRAFSVPPLLGCA